MALSSFEARVIKVIKQVPSGKIATYGQIAALAQSPRSARAVGMILRHKSEQHNLPWHRVTAKNGYISIENLKFPAELQAQLLKKEGVEIFKEKSGFRANYAKYFWPVTVFSPEK